MPYSITLDIGEYKNPYTDGEAGNVRPDYKYLEEHHNCIFLHNHNTDSELSFPDVCLVVNDKEINYVAAIRDDGIITIVKSNGEKTSEYLPLILSDTGEYDKIREELKKIGADTELNRELRQRDAIIKHYCEGGMKVYGEK